MKKKIRIWTTALLCGMLAVGCVISAGAADHPCIKREIPKEDQSYRDTFDGKHEVKYHAVYVCQTCGGFLSQPAFNVKGRRHTF